MMVRTHSFFEQLLIFSTAILLLSVAVGATYVDRFVHDLDGDAAYAFPTHGQDSPAFVALGERLAHGEGFVTEDGRPETFRTPGYPVLIAFSLMLSGGLALLILLQVALASGIVVLTYRIGKELFGVLVGCVAAIFMLLSPNVGFHSLVALSDVPMTFFLIASIYLLFFTKPTSSTYVAAGFSLGVAALIRPIALYLPVLVVLFLLYQAFRNGSIRADMKYLAVFIVAFVVCVLPWHIRNGLETGTYGFATIALYNVASYNVPQFLGETFGSESPEYITYREAFDALGTAHARSFEGADEVRALLYPVLREHAVAYGMYHAVESLKFFLSSSVRYVVLHINIESFQHFFGLTQDAPNLLSLVRSGDWVLVFNALGNQALITFDRLFVGLLTLFAFCAVFVTRRRYEVLFFLALVFYFALLTGPVSVPRYRLPVEPFLAILAVYAFFTVWNYVAMRVVIFRNRTKT